MKTKIRTTEYSQNGYNFTNIEILDTKYEGGHLNPIGSVRFQQTNGEDYWYGMRFLVETDRIFDLERFTRVCKKINSKSDWNLQPLDIKRILNAVEHKFCNSTGVFIEAKN
jgi:hypothetical protein